MTHRSHVITETDFDRLSGLVHSRQVQSSYGQLVSRLKDELGRGAVVETGSVPRNVVTMNSRIRIRDTGTGERETYTLTYPHEADINDARMSVLAPLGMALLGRQAGDVVKVETPSGVRNIKIERVLYQPESAGDLHL